MLLSHLRMSNSKTPRNVQTERKFGQAGRKCHSKDDEEEKDVEVEEEGDDREEQAW